MSRTHVHRRQRRRSYQGDRGGLELTPGLALLSSLLIGALLEWLRTYITIFQSDWRADLALILAAAWACLVLLARSDSLDGDELPRRAALVFVLLLLGSVVMHNLMSRGWFTLQ